MSMMKTLYYVHHCDEMSEETVEGLMRLHDENRIGPLDEQEIRALTTSPAMRDWVRSEAASYGMFAARQWAKGGDAGPIASWYAARRPHMREKLREVLR